MNRYPIRSLPVLLAVAALAACGGKDAPARAAEEGKAPAPATQPANGAAPDGAAPVGGVAEPGDTPVSDGGSAPAGSTTSFPGSASAGTPGGAPATAGTQGTSPSAPSTAGAGSQPSAPGASAPPAQGQAAEILRAAERAATATRTLEAGFSQTVTVPLLDQTQRSRGRLYQRKPDRFLMRFTEPAGDVMVADGRHFWIYYPSVDAKQVIRASLAEGAGAVDLQRQFLSNPVERFNATLEGTESVGGRPAWVLTLVPRREAGFRRLKVWIDRADHLARRFEITEENESVRRIELSGVRVNGNVPASLFTFTPPAGAQVFEQ